MSKTPHTPTHALIHDHRRGRRHWVSLTGPIRTLKPGDSLCDRMGCLTVKAVR